MSTDTQIRKQRKPMKIQATNKATGEVIELDADTPEQIVQAYRTAQEYEKAAMSLKEQLKKLVPSLIATGTTSEPINGFQFRMSTVQRMNYDKAVMRETLDPDDYDILVKPNKTLVDDYIKVNLDKLGEASTALRSTMIPDGAPYQVVKLERLDREQK